MQGNRIKNDPSRYQQFLAKLCKNYQTGTEEKTDFFVFFLDILLNFRTTFVNHKGEVVSNSKDITINYIKTWFFLDLVAALPFDFLELFELNLMVSSSFK